MLVVIIFFIGKMMKKCGIGILFIMIVSSGLYSAREIDLDAVEAGIDTNFVNLGKCKVFLKNGNVIEGKVRMRFNFPVYGKNYVDGKFLIHTGYARADIALTEVAEIRLGQVLYPHRGKIMIKSIDGKEYPLKYFIVSREPIQLISGTRRGVVNLRLNTINYIKVER